ncbi:hypothetical protein BDFB_006995 [Asbolus verrucosus]|uniref:Uncharacterized protein n=1 Tax=Asbolus verrucosus TaxID=1661398 RepID=A0A482W2J2_ASBVE|nr:hypothetical protein BDFB_006995 [Asbolus verrucosus]
MLKYFKENELIDTQFDDCPCWQCFDEARTECIDMCDPGVWP